MKIAMLGHKRVPSREGGIEIVVEELATRMTSRGHKVCVYNRKKDGFESPKIYKGVEILEVYTIQKVKMDAVVYSFLSSIKVALGDYDVVHYHAIGPSIFLFIPKFFGKKIIVTVHGLNYKTPKWKGFGEKFIKLGEKITAKLADEIIVLSQQQKEYFLKVYDRATTYIPNGTVIEEKEEPDIIKRKYGLDKNGYVLFVSRIVPGKGLEYLIQAYKKISCNLPLIIAGDTEYLNNYRNKIISMVQDDNRIKMIGFVEGKELHELYSNARLFVFPSEAEGMPICLLEAMSFDCPCLVSDIPENVEVGKSFVRTFISKDINDLANKLTYCLMGNNSVHSREYITCNYSWEKIVDDTLHLYEGQKEDL